MDEKRLQIEILQNAILRNRFETLYQVNSFLGAIANFNQLLKLIMQESSRAVGAQASSILLYDKRHKELYFEVALGEKGKQVKQIRLKIGQGIAGLAAKTRKAINVADVSSDPRFASSVDKKTGFQTRSILAVPVLFRKELVGVLEVMNKREGGAFTSEDCQLLEIVAGQAALAIRNARLYTQLHEKHKALLIAHQQLKEAQEKLIKAEKLSAIGTMASTIIHDIKNPMSAITSFAELLGEDDVNDADRKHFAKVILDETSRLISMTREILEFARGQTQLELKPCRIAEFINDIAIFLKRDFEGQNIHLVTRVDYQEEVVMDSDRIKRVIFNLSTNARDAMAGSGGTFTIETCRVGQELELRLSDTGSGIPPQVKQKLFEPFVTFGKKHGTGLGMAIVRNIIEAHAGTIRVESVNKEEVQPGQPTGTTFYIRLPLRPPSPAQPAAK